MSFCSFDGINWVAGRTSGLWTCCCNYPRGRHLGHLAQHGVSFRKEG